MKTYQASSVRINHPLCDEMITDEQYFEETVTRYVTPLPASMQQFVKWCLRRKIRKQLRVPNPARQREKLRWNRKRRRS